MRAQTKSIILLLAVLLWSAACGPSESDAGDYWDSKEDRPAPCEIYDCEGQMREATWDAQDEMMREARDDEATREAALEAEIEAELTVEAVPHLYTCSDVEPYRGPYELKGYDRDCSDFVTQYEAQQFYCAAGGPAHDPHWLDDDNDGIACEWNR
jgi:hypothetical protein